MTQPSGTSDPTTGVTNSKSGRVVDGKLVLWTDKGEPRVIRPVSVENKKLFVDAESMLSLGARAELELPPAGEGEARSRVRVEVAFWNLGVGATIVGTLTGTPIVTTAAGCALVVALGLFIATTKAPNSTRRSGRVVFRAVAGIVLVSIPIGLGLAWSRHP